MRLPLSSGVRIVTTKTKLRTEVPQNIDAEKAVLGSILVDCSCIHSIRSVLKPEHFFDEHNQAIYKCCGDITDRGEAIDQLTLARELHAKNVLSDTGGAAYLSHLIVETPTSLHAVHYARIVRNLAVNRMAIKMGAEIAELGFKETDPQNMISEIERKVLNLEKHVAMPQLITPQEWAEMGMVRYSDLDKATLKRGLSFGIEQVDFHTGGIYPGQFWIVGGRAGIGKTTVLLKVADAISKTGNVLLCSLEMTDDEILDRIMAEILGVSVVEIMTGRYTARKKEFIYDGLCLHVAEIAERRVYYYGKGGSLQSGGITTTSLYSLAYHMKMSYGLSAIIVDYIQLFRDKNGDNPYQRMSYISKEIKNIAMALEVPIICASQLTRSLETRIDKRPMMSDLRDAGSLEEDANVIVFLYRDDYYNDQADNKGQAELLIAKNRQGESNIKINLNWDSARRIYYE